MAAATAYPKIPAKSWKILRDRAATAPSTKFTPSAVAALLGMASPKSAGDNVVGPMKKVGLFEDDGSLTARGNKWRVDSTYAAACDEIIAAVYPDDLSALTDEAGHPDLPQVTTWFQHKGFGGSNARQMAATYVLIAGKHIPDASAPSPKPSSSKPAAKKVASTPVKKAATTTPVVTLEQNAPPERKSSGPNVHLDIQIHIPADASTEQIEQIFASMAKHLYQQ